MSKIVFARTHADFLNQEFGTDYRAYMKSRWALNDYTWVWMVRIDGRVRDGWLNREIDETEIWEEYVDVGRPSFAGEAEKCFRIVVNIVEGSRGREYRILGKYRYDFQSSSYNKHVFKKVMEVE